MVKDDVKNQHVDYSKSLKNDKYERFCQEYMKDSNASAACVRAGYSTVRPDSRGAKLVVIDSIKGRLSHLQAEIAENCGVTAERLMEEWKKIGFANTKDIIAMGNRIKDISQLPTDVAAGISSIATSKTGVKVTMHSKETALEQMGKMIGAYEKDNRQKAENLADFLKAMKNE